MQARIMTLLAETPVHAGSGSDLGAVDLPIQRERHTELPVIRSSGLKGALRDASTRREQDKGRTVLLFGSEPGDEPLKQGELIFTDARLLLFPVRTVGPVFAWVTSPYCLARLERDLAELDAPFSPLRSAAAAAARLKVGQDQAFVASAEAFGGQRIVLEEFEVDAAPKSELANLATALRSFIGGGAALDFWREHLGKGLVLVHEDLLRDFCRHATEVVTRVRLDPKTKTVETGALWTEEYLPADSLLYAMVAQTARAEGKPNEAWDHLKKVVGTPLQVGGNETIGRGLVRARIVEPPQGA